MCPSARTVTVLVVALALLAGLAVGAPAGAQEEPPEPDAPTSTVPADPEDFDPDAPLVDPVDPELVEEVLTTTARLAELDAAITTTLGDIADADEALAELGDETATTREAIAATGDAIVEREDEISTTLESIAELEAQLRLRIIDAYVAGTAGDVGILNSTNIEEIDRRVTRRAISEAHAAADEEVADALRSERRRLRRQRAALEDQQDRLDRREADLTALAEQVTELRAERSELLAQLAEDRAEAAEVAARAEAALGEAMRFVADQLAFLAEIGIDGTVALPPAGFALDGKPLCNAAGIVVACTIAEDVTFLLAAARADGVTLAGGGFRSTAEQIALRIANCGDVYLLPSEACSPPTARPGSSQHELGLAIDFENCSRRDTPCFLWLSERAEEYGLYNLPSEPWHWSSTGN